MRTVKIELTGDILTLFLGELVQKAGFAHSHIPDYDVFEYVGVIIGSGGHFCESCLWNVQAFWNK